RASRRTRRSVPVDGEGPWRDTESPRGGARRSWPHRHPAPTADIRPNTHARPLLDSPSRTSYGATSPALDPIRARMVDAPRRPGKPRIGVKRRARRVARAAGWIARFGARKGYEQDVSP